MADERTDPAPEDQAQNEPRTEVHGPEGQLEHPAVQYDRSEVSLRAVLVILAGVACLAAFQYWVVWWFFWDYNGYEAAIKKSPYPLAPEPSMRLPAEPRLEQLDRAAGVERPDVFLRLEDKEQLLHGLGPTPDKGFVHIPIERAMALVLKQLPAGPAPPPGPAKNNGLLDDGEPNSGRRYTGERR